MTKICVITEGGKLVASFLPAPKPKDPKAPVSTPIAGPKQKLHELEIEDAVAYYKDGKVADLHKIIKRELKLK